MSPPSAALGFARQGERVRHAVEALDRIGPRIVTVLRRAAPFLGRRGFNIRCSSASVSSLEQVQAELSPPFEVTPFLLHPFGAKGALFLDREVIAIFIDGALGGDGSYTLESAKISPAQRALVRRVTNGILRSLREAFAVEAPTAPESASVSFEALDVELENNFLEGVPLAISIELESATRNGRMTFIVEKEALLPRTKSDKALPVVCHPAVASTLRSVELEIVAELGRIRMKLSDLAHLSVGDTLNLNARVDGLVQVRTGSKVLFNGQPTASGGQIAIRIERHAG